MSSIDDEFASLFLPDLELIKSLSGNNANSNGFGLTAENRSEDLQTSPYSMTSFPTETTHDYDASAYSNASSAHWLHHYDKLNNTYGLALNQLQQPYVGYDGQQHQTQIHQPPSYPVPVDQTSGDVAGGSTFLNLQKVPDALDIMSGRLNQQDIDLKETFSENSYPRLESSASPTPTRSIQDQAKSSADDVVKKKKESSSEYSHLLNLVLEKADESIVLYDKDNRKTDFHTYGEIDGRFLYSESDLRDPSTTRISCYRRNYLQISFSFEANNGLKFMSTPTHNKLTIIGLKFAVHATTNFSDDKIELMIFGNDGKKSTADPGITYMKNTTQEIPLEMVSHGLSERFSLRKAQFRSATPNNGKTTIFQNYYYILVSISAKTAEAGEVPLASLKSVPIKVRGRNPSFYNDRNDILITKDSAYSQGRELYQESGVQNSKANQLREPTPLPKPEVINTVVVKQPYTKNTTSKNNHTGTDLDGPVSLSPNEISQRSESAASIESKTPSNYEYFPISNVYYLPPLDAHYFPHGVHHPRQSSIVRHREQAEGQARNNSHKDEKPTRHDLQSAGEKPGNNGFMETKLAGLMNQDNNSKQNNRRGYFYDSS